MIDKNSIDADITQEELTRVNNALDALSQTNESPNETQWRNIMEETKKSENKLSSRTKILSIAASFLLVALISTVVATQFMNSEVEQADKKPIETIPTEELTPEEALLANAILLQPNPESWGFRAAIFDGHGNPLTEHPTTQVALPAGSHGGYLSMGLENDCPNRSPSRLQVSGLLYSFKDNIFKESDEIEIYSKSGKMKASGKIFCNSSSVVTIKDSDGKTIREYSPVFGRTMDAGFGYEGIERKSIDNLHWIDDQRLIISIRDVLVVPEGAVRPQGGPTAVINDDFQPGIELGEYSISWHVLDINEHEFLDQAPIIPNSAPYCCAVDEEIALVFDSIIENGRTLILTAGYDENSDPLRRADVRDLATGEIVRSLNLTDIFGNNAVNPGLIQFGKSSSVIYGTAEIKEDSVLIYKAFGHDFENNVTVKPDGAILLPRK